MFVGNDWRRKGLVVLLRALEEVAKAVPQASLVVIGDFPGPERPKILELAARHHVADRVSIVGPLGIAELTAYLWHGDVFVLPSYREALGVAVIEAMAAGMPVVATEVGGIPEAVRDHREGLLCQPGDPRELAAHLTLLLKGEKLRHGFAEAALERATTFRVEQMLAAFKSLYFELLQRRRGGRR